MFQTIKQRSYLWWRGGDVVVLAFILWLVPSIPQILKYTGFSGLILLSTAGLVWIVGLTATFRRHAAILSVRWLVAACLLVVVLFAVLYPVAHSGVLGRGSDRDDALNVALRALLNGHDPYRAKTYLGNPPDPMPGSLVIALPFYAIGNSAFQNLFWIPVFFWWSWRTFGETLTGLWLALVFVVGCPASLQDFITGGDYLVNALYVAMAIDFALATMQSKTEWHRYVAALVLSLSISSRPIYAMAIPVLAGAVFQLHGWRRMLEFLAPVALVCAVVNGPFYFHDPSHFPTVNEAHKLSDVPPWFHASLALPAIGALIGCCSFFVRMDRERVFGLVALSLAPMFYLLLIYRLLVHSDLILTTLAYSLPVSIFGGIWLAFRLAAESGVNASKTIGATPLPAV